jgi:hypothetical protein
MTHPRSKGFSAATRSKRWLLHGSDGTSTTPLAEAREVLGSPSGLGKGGEGCCPVPHRGLDAYSLSSPLALSALTSAARAVIMAISACRSGLASLTGSGSGSTTGAGVTPAAARAAATA